MSNSTKLVQPIISILAQVNKIGPAHQTSHAKKNKKRAQLKRIILWYPFYADLEIYKQKESVPSVITADRRQTTCQWSYWALGKSRGCVVCYAVDLWPHRVMRSAGTFPSTPILFTKKKKVSVPSSLSSYQLLIKCKIKPLAQRPSTILSQCKQMKQLIHQWHWFSPPCHWINEGWYLNIFGSTWWS